MDYDINPSTVMYGISAFLGAVTVVYFGSSLIFDLSPITKSLAFFSSFAVFLAAGLYLSGKNKVHSILALGLTGVSYLAFLAYTLGKFEIGTEGVFTALFLSSLLFVALGNLASRGKLEVDRKNMRYLLVLVVVLGGVLILADVLGAQASYSLELQESVTLEPGENAVIGVLTVSNDFVLPREVSEPSFSSCIGGDMSERGFYTRVDTDELIGGFSENRYNLTADVSLRRFMNESKTFRIERTGSCPDQRDNETIYVFQHDQTETVRYID